MNVVLTPDEIATLFLQDPATERDGGYQRLLVGLQGAINRENGEIHLDAAALEKIPRYAFSYGNGGWENRLVGIFGRTLGPRLDGNIG